MADGAAQGWVKKAEVDEGDGLTLAEMGQLTELAIEVEARVTGGPLAPPSA
ncbi:hypothetical protein LWF15_20205 [Kineosporia rhizophila]|uniref:hypothetical protein n=1 Tax=Kineosporia TaxID=49184 RepID=UPI000AE75F2E|nr:MULTISPECIES: hypothetical protein [Kineosporia]MCE0537820.1 hypothetical protein [Kineosporia rhizophila]GLY15810.1 hypothetical protein Kisp01_28250 [Kineosporia sp. NBRC 101677]